MKLLMVCNTRAQFGGGAEVFCEQLALRLSNAGVDVEVSHGTTGGCFSPTDLPRVENRIMRKMMFDYWNPHAALRIRDILSDLEPDIVHFHNVYGISSQLIHTATRLGYGTVVTIHDKWPFCYRQGISCGPTPLSFMHRIIRRAQLSQAFLVSPSRFLLHLLKASGFRRVTHIPNGIDVPQEMSNDAKRAIFVGRLDRTKGIGLIPRIAEILNEQGVSVEIAGAGPHVHELKQLERKGIVKVHGFLSRERLNELYLGGGVLLFLSETEENFPMTILEALSFGIPVVAINRGGVSELVIDGENGYLTSPNPAVIASRVLSILDDRKLRESMRNRAREYASTFNWNRVIRAYLQLYNSILNV